jgi:hypothetical protein
MSDTICQERKKKDNQRKDVFFSSRKKRVNEDNKKILSFFGARDASKVIPNGSHKKSRLEAEDGNISLVFTLNKSQQNKM